jgi:lysozyme family protein
MKASYPESIAFVLRQEGGYSNNPKDPGGPTNFGITIFDVRKYWKANATAADVKALPLEAAKIIYQKHYWTPVRGDDLPAGLDVCTFDSAVNSGVGRANLWLGKAIGSPAKDYPTLAKQASSVTDIPKSVKSFCATRLSFLHNLRTWSVFGKGWGRRVSELQALGLSLALRASGKTKQETADVLKKESAKVKKDQTTTVSTGAGTTGPTGAGTVATWQWDFTHVGLVVALAAVVLFIAWRIVHNSHQAKAYDDEIARLEALSVKV